MVTSRRWIRLRDDQGGVDAAVTCSVERSPIGTLSCLMWVTSSERAGPAPLMCWRSETGWVGPSWEWIGAQS